MPSSLFFCLSASPSPVAMVHKMGWGSFSKYIGTKKDVEESTPFSRYFLFPGLASATEGIASIDRQKQGKVHAMRCENPLFSIIPFFEGVFFDFEMFNFCSVTCYHTGSPNGLFHFENEYLPKGKQLTGTLCMCSTNLWTL